MTVKQQQTGHRIRDQQEASEGAIAPPGCDRGSLRNARRAFPEIERSLCYG